jgi:hypothetical protein
MKVKVLKTLHSPLSSAEICRRNGWRRGSRIVGVEDQRATTIRITAVGDDYILAIADDSGHEGEWNLTCRNWRHA